LAEEILFGKLRHGGTVRVEVDTQDTKKLSLEIIAADEPVKHKSDVIKDGDIPKKTRKKSPTN